MGDPHIQIETEQPPVLTPLLNSTQSHTNQNRQHPQENPGSNRRTDLDQALSRLETFLSFLGFNQSSLPSFLLSWTAFLLIGVLLPVLILELSQCSGCQQYQIKDFELDIVASQACLAAVSLICLSNNLRKYGLRKFLFLDRYSGSMSRLSHLYTQQIKLANSSLYSGPLDILESLPS